VLQNFYLKAGRPGFAQKLDSNVIHSVIQAAVHLCFQLYSQTWVGMLDLYPLLPTNRCTPKPKALARACSATVRKILCIVITSTTEAKPAQLGNERLSPTCTRTVASQPMEC
jgi:hypothetical protein